MRSIWFMDIPMKSSPMDIVSIVFEGDADLLNLQLVSFSKLFRVEDINRFIVVLNGKDNTRLRSYIWKRVAPFAGQQFAQKLAFIDANAITKLSQGWRGQQIIKLMVSRIVETSHYLCLDAKNHLIKPASLSNFHAPDGRIKARMRMPPGDQIRLLTASLDYFGANTPEIVETAMPMITPYIFHTDTVRRLVTEVEKREKKPFAIAFEEKLQSACEFFLYYAYLRKAAPEVFKTYVHAGPICETLFTKWPQGDDCTRILGNLDQRWLIMFGLHRTRAQSLQGEHKNKIVEHWSRAGLPLSVTASVFSGDFVRQMI